MQVRIAPKPLTNMQQVAIAPRSPSDENTLDKRKAPVVLPTGGNRWRRQQIAIAANTAILPSPTQLQPSSKLVFQGVDSQYFDLFRIHTASQLSGYFNSDFWTKRVLQECHSNAAIRHSVVALGALYKSLDQSSVAIHGENAAASRYNSVVAHWQVAIRQYSEACNAMMTMNDSIAGDGARLMATILLVCFDSFIGDHKQAIVQIQTGLGLLQQYKAGYSQTTNNRIEDDISNLFTRLAIQAKSYDMAFHFPEPYVIRLLPEVTAPTTPESDVSSPPAGSPVESGQFASLLEARLASDKLCETMAVFIERMQRAKADPSYVLPANWKKFGMGFKDRLEAWSKSFEPIFQSRHNPSMSYLEKSGIAALKMFQVNILVLFLMMFCDNELQFDSFIPHFTAIVRLGWEIVEADERKAVILHQHQPGSARSSFSADMGIVPPLYVVATKCRDPGLRREAIRLLRSSARREGMWDSELTANIGTWVMQVEESGLHIAAPSGSHQWVDSDGAPQKVIPEEQRIMVKSVDFDLKARFAELRVGTRSAYRGAQDERFKQTRISW